MAQNLKISAKNLERERKSENKMENQQEIDYTFINFQPTIRKLKMDVLQNREPDEALGTDYLRLLNKDPQEIHYIDDMFLACLLFRVENSKDHPNQNFYG